MFLPSTIASVRKEFGHILATTRNRNILVDKFHHDIATMLALEKLDIHNVIILN